MIHLVLPDVQGGVYDFVRTLQVGIGSNIVSLVPLSVDNVRSWKISAGNSVLLQMRGYGFGKPFGRNVGLVDNESGGACSMATPVCGE